MASITVFPPLTWLKFHSFNELSLAIIYLVIPMTVSTGARVGEYGGSISTCRPSLTISLLVFFREWIEALSVSIITLSILCLFHIFRNAFMITKNLQNPELSVVLWLIVEIQLPSEHSATTKNKPHFLLFYINDWATFVLREPGIIKLSGSRITRFINIDY